MDKASRGGKLAVSRDEFMRNLRREFRDTTYPQLRAAIMNHEREGLLSLEWMGPDNFDARLTPKALAQLHPPTAPPSPAAPSASVPPRPAASSGIVPPSRSPDRSPSQGPPPDQPGPATEPEAPPERPSTFADLKEDSRRDAPSRFENGKGGMEEWLNTRLDVLSEREEAVSRREEALAHRTLLLQDRATRFSHEAAETERKLGSELERVMEELVRQEHLVGDRIAASPGRDTGLGDVLQKVRACETALDRMDKERTHLRKLIKEMRELTEEQDQAAH